MSENEHFTGFAKIADECRKVRFRIDGRTYADLRDELITLAKGMEAIATYLEIEANIKRSDG